MNSDEDEIRSIFTTVEISNNIEKATFKVSSQDCRSIWYKLYYENRKEDIYWNKEQEN